MCEWDEPASRGGSALAAFPQWPTSHIADKGFGQSTDFRMIGRKSRQGTTVALDDELIILRFHFGEAAQLIEGRDRVLKPSNERTVGGRIATGEMAATGAQQGFNQIWRQAPLKPI
jgi:hypothetical protein